jgi:hypothetical protein
VTANEMSRRATECRELAAVEQHLETKRILLELAKEWEHLARWRRASDPRPAGAAVLPSKMDHDHTAAS